MAKAMTYAEAINLAIEGNLNDEAIERLNALKAQLAKRNSSGALKKPTVDGMTATEIGSALAISCQKASAILSQMVKAEVVAKVKEGKVTRFVLA